MAERRTRPNPMDRRLFISERTAKSLSLQASARVYQTRPPRRFHLFDVPLPLPDPDLSDPEDDMGRPPASSSIEGVRLNSDLYDAYIPAHLPMDEDLRHGEPDGTASRVIAEFPPYPGIPGEQEQVTSPRPPSPPASGFRNSFWGTIPARESSLQRTHTLRRPSRSRMDAFSDFTSRRRLVTRPQQSTESSRHDDGRWDFGGASSSRVEDSSTSAASAATLSLHNHHTARRYFPLSALTTTRRRPLPLVEPLGSYGRESSPLGSASSTASTPAVTQDDQAGTSGAAAQSSSQLWYSLTSGRVSPAPSSSSEYRRHSISGESSSERRALAPRLRRGGLRAPESLLSRYASPSMEPIGTETTIERPEPPLTEDPPHSSAEAGTTGEHVAVSEGPSTETSLSLTTGRGTSWEVAEESQQLLTPRSVSPPPTENT